ncbi:MAG: ComEC/Rec2 family competence protein [Acidobacteria bacterium]|nr:ComEC/Rec2 family competence protein [Acidobacteriota bacterium]
MPPSRQPLLWAALAYAAGLAVGPSLWRPALWWMVACVSFLAFAGYYLSRRSLPARGLALAVLFAMAALTMQIPPAPPEIIPAFAEGIAVEITGHVKREGNPQPRESDVRQQFDIETETVSDEDTLQPLGLGVRLSLYGPGGPALHYGDRLRVFAQLNPPHNFRNPGAFDYVAYLRENGVTALASAKANTVECLPGFAGNRAELWRTRIHRNILQKVHALWPEEQAALMDAMVIGEDAFLDPATRTGFQRTGTYHVLVVSGLNVGILAFVVFWVLRRLRLSEALAGGLAVLLAVAYALLTNVGAPIWRATLMLALFLGARLLHRGKSMLNAVGAAALGLMITDPHALFGASFQLTFLCVLLIAAIGVPILERTSQPTLRGLRQLDNLAYDFALPPRTVQYRLDLRMVAGRLGRFLGRKIPLRLLTGLHRFVLGTFEVLLISGIMQLGLVLPMAYYFHRVTVFGLAANLLVVPLTELLMPTAVLAVGLGYLSLTLAKIPALCAGLALQGITGTVHGLGGTRIADTRVPTPEFGLVLFSAATLVAAMLLARRRKWLVAAGIAGLAVAAILLCVFPLHPDIRPRILEITAIDVGQGDSLFIVTPEGRTLLVDSGGMPSWMHSEFDMGEQVVSPYLWSRGVKRLDAVLVTHPHADHMGGMASWPTSIPGNCGLGRSRRDRPEVPARPCGSFCGGRGNLALPFRSTGRETPWSSAALSFTSWPRKQAWNRLHPAATKTPWP